MKIRKFNGKNYRLADTVIGKRNADERAEGFRARGDKVRLVCTGKYTKTCQVWVRDKLVR